VSDSSNPDTSENFDALEARLTRALGVIVGGQALTRALGYPSQTAFRQAYARDRLPVAVFSIPGRRGRFALVGDIARWIWAHRSTHTDPEGSALSPESKEAPDSKPMD